jgi:hypothetical protein
VPFIFVCNTKLSIVLFNSAAQFSEGIIIVIIDFIKKIILKIVDEKQERHSKQISL